MKTQAIKTLETEGVQAAIHFIQQARGKPAEKIKTFNEVLRHAYWQQKDLPGAIQIGQAGIDFGDTLITKYPEKAFEIKSRLKAIHYNLASFTWPGWDEKDYKIHPDQIQLGLQAAKTNLELAVELEKGALPISRAYWMLAAQQIAAGKFQEAQENFSHAAQHAQKANSKAEMLLSDGFLHVVGLLADPNNENFSSKLAEIKNALLKEKHGKIFISQLEDALRVFRD